MGTRSSRGVQADKAIVHVPMQVRVRKTLMDATVTEPPATVDPTEDPSADWVIRGHGVSKRFDIYRNDRGRIYEFLGNRQHHIEHWALKGVDFEVRRGRSFGIIGPNGAGKSTLLKLIGGITRPTEGVLEIRASLSTLLDLGLGFHKNFSGRENIRLNCSLLGMGNEQIEDAIPHIIEFAELGDFIDYPVRTYSAGMNLRLGFAIAAQSQSDIFLIDEVLAVGDQYFQRRCVQRIEEFQEAGRTILLVSHDLHAIRSLCDDALWIDQGQVRAMGPAREVVDLYLDIERERASGGRAVHVAPFLVDDETTEGPVPQPRPVPVRAPKIDTTVDDPKLVAAISETCAVPDADGLWAERTEAEIYDVNDGEVPVIQGTGEIRVLDVKVLDGNGRPRSRFGTGEDLVVAVTFHTTEPIPDPIFGVAIFRADGVYVHGPNTRFDQVLGGSYHGIYTFFIRWKQLPLLNGRYRLSVAVFDKSHLKPHVWHNQLYDFEIASEVEDHGLAMLDHAWGLITHLEG
jgi:ABC-type polysaccharide/polyol phosphate transport system ATPase subunit